MTIQRIEPERRHSTSRKMQLVILTGASGSGKTTIANRIALRSAGNIEVQSFDSVGVPPHDQMLAEHGSAERWQRMTTFQWFARLAALREKRSRILFEGQMRPSVVAEAAKALGIDEYSLVLLDCDDATRSRRLRLGRGQPDLVNPTMTNWARYLRGEAKEGGYEIIDTSYLPLTGCVQRILAYF
jgi:ABC-type branched-subunit amino acid transport system ATPase component